jgi:hypothetical protein
MRITYRTQPAKNKPDATNNKALLIKLLRSTKSQARFCHGLQEKKLTAKVPKLHISCREHEKRVTPAIDFFILKRIALASVGENRKGF